jgi:hypothetical protein
VIDLANLNTHIAIPVLHKAGRGTNFTYDLSYDSSAWYKITSNGTTSWQPVYNWGWRGVTEAGTGYVSYDYTSSFVPFCYWEIWDNYVYHDAWGFHTGSQPRGHTGTAVVHCTIAPMIKAPREAPLLMGPATPYPFDCGVPTLSTPATEK